MEKTVYLHFDLAGMWVWLKAPLCSKMAERQDDDLGTKSSGSDFSY